MHQGKTAVLLSGGMDSIAIAYWKKPDIAITVNYGQNCADAEIKTSEYIAEKLGIEHHIINVDCSSLGTGTLSKNGQIDNAPSEEWWPYRNQLLVTLACMKCIRLGVSKLYVGSVKQDGERHRDGTKQFYDLLSSLLEYQEGQLTVEMPAANLSTLELIKESNVPYSLLLHSHSCHTSNKPCLKCSGCYKNYGIRLQLGIG